jgi:hypothetical protein
VRTEQRDWKEIQASPQRKMNFLEQIAPRFWIGFVSSREAIECRPVRAFRYAKYFGMGPDIATDPLYVFRCRWSPCTSALRQPDLP